MPTLPGVSGRTETRMFRCGVMGMSIKTLYQRSRFGSCVKGSDPLRDSPLNVTPPRERKLDDTAPSPTPYESVQPSVRIVPVEGFAVAEIGSARAIPRNEKQVTATTPRRLAAFDFRLRTSMLPVCASMPAIRDIPIASGYRHIPVAPACHHEPVPDSRFTIRPARPEGAPHLQHIELATQGQFAAIGFDQVAASPPDSIELLVEYARSERSWVAVVDEEVVGYVLVGALDDAAHIFHVCVHPAHQGHGVGKALIEQVKSWARSAGRPAVTLATFYEVPWNGPLYEHLGFRVLHESEVGPEMLARGEHDVAGGLSPARQVAMRLDLDI
jgi:GNAT superfamily N-acetyltransferase